MRRFGNYIETDTGLSGYEPLVVLGRELDKETLAHMFRELPYALLGGSLGSGLTLHVAATGGEGKPVALVAHVHVRVVEAHGKETQ